MNLTQLTQRALEIRHRYAAVEGASPSGTWSRTDLMQGFVVDVGQLMRLVMAKEGRRREPDVDQRLAHELADCLWSVLVLADAYDVDLEDAFLRTMAELEQRLSPLPPDGTTASP